MSKEKKRFVRIMKGVPEFMYMTEEQAKLRGTKGGWILSPEPPIKEKEVWTPEEPEEEEVEIDTTIRAEGDKELQLTETPVVKRGRKPKQ